MVPVSQRFCYFNAVVLSVACMLAGIVPETHTNFGPSFSEILSIHCEPFAVYQHCPQHLFRGAVGHGLPCGGALAPPMAEDAHFPLCVPPFLQTWLRKGPSAKKNPWTFEWQEMLHAGNE